jgi:HSP20 family protein
MATENVNTKQPKQAAAPERTRNGRFYRPDVDILERADELLVLADLPGVKSDQIDIKFDKGTLTLHAAAPARQNENQEYLLREYGVGDYYRSFQVNETIDAGRITAEYGDGVLTLHLPKVEKIKPRKINVSTK